MRPISELHFPPAHLSGCIFGAIYRDTRGTSLSDAQRFNHFPASPLVSITYLIDGDLRIITTQSDNDFKRHEQMPQYSVTLPQERPITSWSAGPISVISIGFYPDAWAKLDQNGQLDFVAATLCNGFCDIKSGSKFQPYWANFCDTISPVWQDVRASGRLADWSGSARLSDWSRSVLSRAVVAGSGQSMRAIERRLKRWSSQSRQSLKFYSDIENLHMLSVNNADAKLAGLASDAGYSDQSHMGRAVQRATGFSPAHLNQLIKTQEAFWCYRLLGERF